MSPKQNPQPQPSSQQNPQPQSAPHQNPALENLSEALPPEVKAEMTQNPSGKSEGGAEHLADITAGLEPDAGASGGAPEIVTAEIVTKEEFRASFVGGFNFGGMFMGAMKIAPDEIDRANAAADALYETALEVHWLRFLLDRQSVWLGRIIVISSFIVPKTKAVMKEIRDKKNPPAAVAAPTSAAPVITKAGPRDPEPDDNAVVKAT